MEHKTIVCFPNLDKSMDIVFMMFSASSAPSSEVGESKWFMTLCSIGCSLGMFGMDEK